MNINISPIINDLVPNQILFGDLYNQNISTYFKIQIGCLRYIILAMALTTSRITFIKYNNNFVYTYRKLNIKKMKLNISPNVDSSSPRKLYGLMITNIQQ